MQRPGRRLCPPTSSRCATAPELYFTQASMALASFDLESTFCGDSACANRTREGKWSITLWRQEGYAAVRSVGGLLTPGRYSYNLVAVLMRCLQRKLAEFTPIHAQAWQAMLARSGQGRDILSGHLAKETDQRSCERALPRARSILRIERTSPGHAPRGSMAKARAIVNQSRATGCGGILSDASDFR